MMIANNHLNEWVQAAQSTIKVINIESLQHDDSFSGAYRPAQEGMRLWYYDQSGLRATPTETVHTEETCDCGRLYREDHYCVYQ